MIPPRTEVRGILTKQKPIAFVDDSKQEAYYQEYDMCLSWI